MNKQKPPYRNPGPVISREEFIHNFISASNGCLWTNKKQGDDILKCLIGSVYDLQQTIEYLAKKIIDLEGVVYAIK